MKRLRQSRFTLIALAASTALSVACGGDDSSNDVAAGDGPELAIVNGTQTARHPEVGRIVINGWGCTATLVSPRHFITAAHCLPGQWVLENQGTFEIDGQAAIPISRFHGFGSLDGGYDIAVGLLSSDVPASVATPAKLATVLPDGGAQVTTFGYGCQTRDDPTTMANNEETYDNNKYSRSYRWGNDTAWVCHGDSGGPTFLGDGKGTDVQTIVAITSGNFQELTGLDYRAEVPIQKLRIEQVLREWDSDSLERDVDRPGLDYRTLTTATAFGCQSECNSDTSCRAFTFRTSTSQCFLKSGMAERHPFPGAISGVSRDNGFEYDVDRPGSDLGAATELSDADTCARMCELNDRCQAFSYEKSTKKCFLKRVAAPVYGPNTDTISGVRRGWELHVDMPGEDIDQFEITNPEPQVCQAACDNNTSCKAWTLVTWSDPGTHNWCWLKGKVPQRVYGAYGRISGVRGGAF